MAHIDSKKHNIKDIYQANKWGVLDELDQYNNEQDATPNLIMTHNHIELFKKCIVKTDKELRLAIKKKILLINIESEVQTKL